MKRLSLFSVIADSIFAAACAFAIIFTAVRFYTKNPALGLGLGIAAFLLFGALAFFKLNAKRGKAINFGKNQSRRQAFRTYLCSLTQKDALEVILPATGGNICDGGIENGDKFYIARFTPQPLSPNDMCGAIAFESNLKKVVVCNGATDEAIKFAALFGVEIKLSDEIFDRLDETGSLPEKYPFPDAVKPKLRQKFKGAIKRSNARGLFWCGLWLTAFSYFTFFPAYYIIAGGILLLLAAICLIFERRE